MPSERELGETSNKKNFRSPSSYACACGHALGVHVPDPQMLFAWPCRACSCREYGQKEDRSCAEVE
jgi:hypothetical protein